MKQNLRFRLSEKSTLNDLANAIKDPFNLDSYDLGMLFYVGYNKNQLSIYDENKDSKIMPHTLSLPRAIFFSKIAHRIPTYNSLKKSLFELSNLQFDSNALQDNYFSLKEEIEQNHNARRYIAKNSINELNELNSAYIFFRKESIEKDKLKFKPSFLDNPSWLGDSSTSIVHNGLHNFGNEWGQRLFPRYFGMNFSKYLTKE